MAHKTPIRWFRFFTSPILIGSVALTIAAAEESSPTLMFIAAGAAGVGVGSMLAKLWLDRPAPTSRTGVGTGPTKREQQHVVAHHV